MRYFSDDRYNSFLSVIGAVASGLLIGVTWQKIADSGEFHLAKVVTTCFVSIGSYLLAVIAFGLISPLSKIRKAPEWLFVAVVGSLLCSLNLRVIKFFVDNWRYRASGSASDYLIAQLSQASTRFFLTAPILILIAVLMLLTIQLLGRQIQRLFTS